MSLREEGYRSAPRGGGVSAEGEWGEGESARVVNLGRGEVV